MQTFSDYCDRASKAYCITEYGSESDSIASSSEYFVEEVAEETKIEPGVLALKASPGAFVNGERYEASTTSKNSGLQVSIDVVGLAPGHLQVLAPPVLSTSTDSHKVFEEMPVREPNATISKSGVQRTDYIP